MNIKILKSESLIEFTNWFFKLAQELKFNGTLDLINIKNAMEQDIKPYRHLAIACASPLANAINLKEVINLLNC